MPLVILLGYTGQVFGEWRTMEIFDSGGGKMKAALWDPVFCLLDQYVPDILCPYNR